MVLTYPDASTGVEVDAPPELLPSESGGLVAAFRKPPVRDDIEDAVRRTQMWLPHQEPALASFLNGCEAQVGVHIGSLGASSMTDGLHGFGPRVRGSERNVHIYVAEYPRVERRTESQRREDPGIPFPDDPDLLPVLACNTDRPMPHRNAGAADVRDLEEQMLDMEREFGDLAGLHGDLVVLVSNVEGVTEPVPSRAVVQSAVGAVPRRLVVGIAWGRSHQRVGVGIGDIVEHGVVRRADCPPEIFLVLWGVKAGEGEQRGGLQQSGRAHAYGTSLRLSHSAFSTKPTER